MIGNKNYPSMEDRLNRRLTNKKGLIQSGFSAAIAYSLGEFDAEQERRLAELDASIEKETSDAEYEADLAQLRYYTYHTSMNTPLVNALSALAAVDFDVDGAVSTLAAARTAFASAATNAAVAAASEAFDDAIHNVWNDAYLQNLLDGASYITRKTTMARSSDRHGSV